MLKMHCKECNLVRQANHSCIHALQQEMLQVQRVLRYQCDRLCLLSGLSENLTNPDYTDPAFHVVHEFVGCDGCGMAPLTGTRFKCKQCVNMDLCSSCRHSKTHEHTEFYPISSVQPHYGINCVNCGQLNIYGLVFHCTHCSVPLCEFCKEGHPHTSFDVRFPYNTTVELHLPNPYKQYAINEVIIATIVIENRGPQTIRSIQLVKDSPHFAFWLPPQSIEVNMDPGEIRCIPINTTCEATPGEYNCVLNFRDTLTNEYISAPLSFTLTLRSSASASIFGLFTGLR